MDTKGVDHLIRTPNLLSGIVDRVNQPAGTVDVKIDEPDGRYLKGCMYISPVQSGNIAGIDFAPVRGSSCIVIENLSTDSPGSLGGTPLVFGFRSRSYLSLLNRGKLVEGDIEVRSERGNSVFLKRNGDIYIVSDDQNYLTFLSTQQLVKARSTSYIHELAGGVFNWSVQADASGGPISCFAEVKRFSTDTKPYFTVKAGTAADGGLDITLHKIGSAPSDEANPLFNNMVQESAGFRFKVSSEGSTEFSSQSLSVETAEYTAIMSNGSVNITAPGVVINSGESSISFKAGQPLKISAPSGLILDAPSIQVASVGAETFSSDTTDDSKRVLTMDLLKWLNNHIHLVDTTPIIEELLLWVSNHQHVDLNSPAVMNPDPPEITVTGITTCPVGSEETTTDLTSTQKRDAIKGKITTLADTGNAQGQTYQQEIIRMEQGFNVESLDDVCSIKTKVR
tara:strand:+ start:1140 stop:2495 length:1356 start_codon:yes stop_codon:yes gene_type:complete